jgi:hypothetical protein
LTKSLTINILTAGANAKLPGYLPVEEVMSQPRGDADIPEPRRKEIFLALVDAQDHEMNVTQSRKLIAEQFGVSEGQIRAIEREGLDQQWPPL